MAPLLKPYPQTSPSPSTAPQQGSYTQTLPDPPSTTSAPTLGADSSAAQHTVRQPSQPALRACLSYAPHIPPTNHSSPISKTPWLSAPFWADLSSPCRPNRTTSTTHPAAWTPISCQAQSGSQITRTGPQKLPLSSAWLPICPFFSSGGLAGICPQLCNPSGHLGPH